jgi:hypothetical protein
MQKEWTDKEITKFSARVNAKFKILELQPRLGKISSKKHNVFRTQVHPKVSLIYRVKPIKKEIELISFWNNLQDSKRIKHLGFN